MSCNSTLNEKIIYNPALQERIGLGTLVFCENENSANSLAAHLANQLLKKDYAIKRYRVDDRNQDAGTIIEILTNTNDIASILAEIIKNLKNIISEGKELTVEIASAYALIKIIIDKYPTLKQPVQTLLSIIKWSKNTDSSASIVSDKENIDINPKDIKYPETIILKAIELITKKNNDKI